MAGLSSSDSPEAARAKLEARCEGLRSVVVEPPFFPLAAEMEEHLVCRNFSVGNKTVESLALTYADGELSMIYAEGNAAEVISGFAREPLQQYLDFSVSFKELLVMDPAADRAWVLSPAAAHPNLFQWPNPYLARSGPADYDSSVKIPGVLGFGKTLEELKPAFDADCAFSHLGTYKVWLLNQPDVQQQIDCFGFEFGGFPRKIEAVFGDGILEQAWILTGKGEEERIREALIAEYGDPVFVNDTWEVFPGKRVMLRKDKPEVLMLSATLAELYFDEEVNPE